MRYFIESFPHGKRIDMVVTYTDQPVRGESALAISLYRYEHHGDSLQATYDHFTVADPDWFDTVQEVPFWALSSDIQDAITSVTGQEEECLA